MRSVLSWEMYSEPLISAPPQAPLPDPAQDPKWYGEVWYKYPQSKSLDPMHFGSIFKARSDFRVILHDISKTRMSTGGRFTAEQVHDFGQRMKTWYTYLPRVLSPKHIALPAHLMLQ